MTTSPRVVSRRTAMAPASPREQTSPAMTGVGSARLRLTSLAARRVRRHPRAPPPPPGLEAQLPAACWPRRWPRLQTAAAGCRPSGLRRRFEGSASPLVTRIKACPSRGPFYRDIVSIRDHPRAGRPPNPPRGAVFPRPSKWGAPGIPVSRLSFKNAGPQATCCCRKR